MALLLGQAGPELAVPCYPKPCLWSVVHPFCVTQPSLQALLLVRRARETLDPRAALAGQFVKPFPALCVPVCRQEGPALVQGV